MYQGVYELVGVELSMYSRKLEAQLRCQNIPWRWTYKTQERQPGIEARVGTHFIPVLITPDKWMLHDTIAIGPLLNDRFPEQAVIPATPAQRACCFILEDAFNHWLGRVCVHTRWCYPDNVAWVGPRFAANTVLDRSIEEPLSNAELEQYSPIGDMMYESFGKGVCENNGVGPDQAAVVQADFNAMLDALAEHFAQNDFLLGPRPCLADFALAGACKAHFITDPVPLSWLGKHKAVIEAYTARCFPKQQASYASWLPDDELPSTLPQVLDYLQGTYYQFAGANIPAGLAGEKYYDYDYGYGLTKARTQKRLNVARLHVQDELQKLGATECPKLSKLMSGRGILEHYLLGHSQPSQ